MNYICLDLEGVLVPEFWETIAEKTGIDELARTTRDEQDYEKLMAQRISILDNHQIKISHLLSLLEGLSPLHGALPFLKEVEELGKILILSDTFHLFANPILKKLGSTDILCNQLIVDETGRIESIKLRKVDGKKCAVRQLKSDGHRVFAVGDSFNDLTMLSEAHGASLFRAPDYIIEKMRGINVTDSYDELLSFIKSFFL